jgi:hypothetical protein
MQQRVEKQSGEAQRSPNIGAFFVIDINYLDWSTSKGINSTVAQISRMRLIKS